MPDWKEISRCFAGLRPAQWIEPEVRVFLETLPSDAPLLLACSGGADSVFLTLAMAVLYPDQPQRLVLAHYNHLLRGADSDADQAFVRDLAGGLGLRFVTGRPDIVPEPVEAVLRESRYGWLSGIYRNERAAALLLGHHADDLVESLLMGVLSGAGPSGLASPMPVRRFPDGQVRLRPLLAVDRERIHRTLRSLGAPWREDASNADAAHTRNWLRQEIIPRLAERFPQNIHAGARRTRLLQQESLEVLDGLVRDSGIDFSNPEALAAGPLREAPAGLVRRTFMAWWMRHHAAEILSKGILDQVVELTRHGEPGAVVALPERPDETNRALCLGADLRLVLRTIEPAPEWLGGIHWVGVAGPLYLPDGACLRMVEHAKGTGDAAYRQADPAREAWLQGVSGPLQVRQWRPGDKYRPLGAPGRRKLQDLFTDAKLEGEQKRKLPVLLNMAGEILWVPGFPPAHRFRICHPGNSALQLTYLMLSPAFRHNHGG